MTNEMEQLLEKEGWTVECESPLEIRHEDGSFATLNAADMVIQYIRNEAEVCSARAALNTIQGSAQLAKQSCEGLMQNLWAAVERECLKGLNR